MTVPGLALRALFYPLPAALSALSLHGARQLFPRSAFLPAVLCAGALFHLPLLRNTHQPASGRRSGNP